MSIKKLALAGGVAAALMSGTAYASIIDRPFFQVLGVVVVWGADGQDAAATAPVVSDFVLLTPASGSAGADLIAADGYSVVTGSLDPISTTATAGVGGTAIDPITGTGSGNFTDAGTVGVLDASDTMAAFTIDNTTTMAGPATSHKSSFFVASNAAFDIYANSSALQGSGDLLANTDLEDISLAMSIQTSGTAAADGVDFGSKAQDPTAASAAAGATAGSGFTASMDLDTISGATPVKVFDGGRKTAASSGSLMEQSVRFDSVYTLNQATGYDLSQGSGTVYADVTYTVFVP